jgi:hypothetical protein
MLRWLVALLLGANLVFFAWSQGWLDSVVGVRATGDRELERLALQVRPDVVRVVTSQAVAAAASEAESRQVCLEAGPFDDKTIGAAEAALATVLPGGTWARVTSGSAFVLRVDRADPDLATKVANLRLDALGRGFAPCARPS